MTARARVLERREDCPEIAKHTPTPHGYAAFFSWCQRMAPTHKQTKCEACGHWSIWVPKRKAGGR